MAKPLADDDLKCPKCGYALAGLPTRRCPECGLRFDPTVLRLRARHARRWRWLISFAVMAFAIYSPFSWLLWIDYPWSEYHWFWLRMWPILPGLPATILLRFVARLPEWAEMICMGVLTALALLLLTWLGVRGRRWLIIVAILAFAVSCYNGWIGYVLFRL